jgi:hypothetical protein
MNLSIKKRKHRTALYFYFLLALTVLLVAATYTWFSLSRQAQVSDMDVYISSGVGIELAAAYDAPDDDWGQVLDFQSLVGEDTVLKPATWSSVRDCLFSPKYGVDGRTIEDSYVVLTDAANANRSDDDAYYVLGTFYVRSDQDVTVCLGDATEVNEGENTAGTFVIGMPIWNSETVSHEDGGSGAECAVRLGLRITYIDKNGRTQTGTTSQFFLYEPNCDTHLDESISGYVATPSADGSETLVDQDHLIRQTTSTWTEADPVQNDITIKQLGEFLDNPELFTLDAGGMAKVDLYIWLEGEDVDCSNLIEDAQIIASLQFNTSYLGQSGMEEIPD